MLGHLSEIFTSYNLMIALLALLSLVGTTIFIERLLFLKRAEIDTTRFLLRLRPLIEEKNIIEAIQVCEETSGPIAAIVKQGLYKHHRAKSDIEQAMEISGMVEIAKLEKNAKMLSVIAHVAPLIGLLGTVLGFIQAFREMRLSGLVDISATRIGEAMEFALITTALGLVVGIPAVVAYNYLVSRIEQYVLEMQATSFEVVDLVTLAGE